MNQITPFANTEFALELISEGDSFKVIASGLGRALGFRDAYNLTASIPEAEKGYLLVSTSGDVQKRVLYVTEAGFYRALGQRQAARVPDLELRASVERFQSWVYGEVLPSIRRTGSYSVTQLSRKDLARMVLEAEEALEEAENRAAAAEHQMLELAPAAHAWDKLASANGDYAVGDAAKILSRDPSIQTGQQRLFTIMHGYGWTYRGADGRWRAKQTAVEIGRLTEVPTSHYHPRTGELILDPPTVRVMVKGLAELHKRLGGAGDVRDLIAEPVAA